MNPKCTIKCTFRLSIFLLPVNSLPFLLFVYANPIAIVGALFCSYLLLSPLEREIATHIAVAIVGSAIAIERTIQKRSKCKN